MSDYWYPTNLITLAEMPVLRKKCVNDEQFTYTGKEASPMGLGHTAHKYVVGDRMKGRDDSIWMVAKKNDVNVWVRVPTDAESLTKDTPVIPAVDAKPVAFDTEPEDKETPTPLVAVPPKRTAKAESKAKPKVKAPSKVKAESKLPAIEVPAETTEADADADADAQAEVDAEPVKEVPKKKAAAKPKKAEVVAEKATELKTKKVSEHNLFVKLQTELAKVDPATKDMDGKARFKYVSQRASELWKTMDAAAKTAAVAGMKV